MKPNTQSAYQVTYSVYDWTIDPYNAIAYGVLTPADGVDLDTALGLYGEHFRNAMQGIMPPDVDVAPTAQIEFNYSAIVSKDSAPQRDRLERIWSKGKGPQLPEFGSRCRGER
jgi:hypothetical protein